MSFFHGVRASEIDTQTRAMQERYAGLPVIIDCAPVHLTSNPTAYVNKPVICHSFPEYRQLLGYSADWDNYGCAEVAYSEFNLYNVKPVLFINVLDPAKHKTTVSIAKYEVNEQQEVIIKDSVLIDTLKVKKTLTDDAATLNKDYTAAYNDDEQLVITLLDGGVLENQTEVYVAYDKLDPSKVTYLDAIGGVNSNGESKGLELLDMIYTMYNYVPGIIDSPRFSCNPTFAAVARAKSRTICGIFGCIVLTDIDTKTATSYMDAIALKNSNNFNGNNQYVLWPCFKNGDMVFRASTHALGVIGVMDAANDDIPSESPSNLDLQATGLCLKDGTEVLLSLTQANVLNEQGIATGLNFGGRWALWGNYTGAASVSNDVKDIFLCVRRMFDWQKQTFITSNWKKVDRAMRPRFIRSIIDDEDIRLNGLAAKGHLLSGSIEFNEEDNPITDLLAGKIKARTKISPPIPTQDIEEIVEYDVEAYENFLS